MNKTRTRATPKRVSGNIKPPVGREVTVDEVIQNLCRLFEHLGLDISQRVSSATDGKSTKELRSPLYPHASEIGELLTSWHQDPTYLDDLGNPAPLKLRGRRPSFRSLAQHVLPEIDVSYLLSELKRLGAVTEDDSNLIHVHMRSLSAYEDKRLAIQHTLTSLDGFIKTLRHNLESTPSNSDQLFHRIARINDFDSREIPVLKIRVKRHGQRFLESFDNWLTHKALPKSGRRYRHTKQAKVSLGVYLSVDMSQ
jgi:hypothetical protein